MIFVDFEPETETWRWTYRGGALSGYLSAELAMGGAWNICGHKIPLIVRTSHSRGLAIPEHRS
jgi:hypothetical protein